MVNIIVKRNGTELERAVNKPVRKMPDGLAGVVYKGKVYPLYEGNEIEVSDKTISKEECPGYFQSIGTIRYNKKISGIDQPEKYEKASVVKSFVQPASPLASANLDTGPSSAQGLVIEAPKENQQSKVMISAPAQSATHTPIANKTFPRAWDSSQERIVKAVSSARLIVEAGPGTGKTAVACARLAFLIRECGVQPSKAWMISFTRTAVAEIRARLYDYLGEDALAVKVATVDSHAWAIHSGYDSTASLTGTYEENIEDVLSLLHEDPEVQEYLEGVEHLIVDEAQDLVGSRGDLVEAIISALNTETGVTIFADEAQAIYGFSEDETAEDIEVPLLGRIRSNDKLGFREAALDTVHRTSSPGLLNIFTEVRSLVKAGAGNGRRVFDEVRAGIAENADAGDLKSTDLKIADMPSGSLVLFRTRSEALEASQYCQTPHSLRLSGYGASLPPWIGLVFYDFIQAHMSKQEFMTRWLGRVENTCPPDYGVEEAWDRLTRAGGLRDGSLDMRLLRKRLGRYSPPIELMVAEYGLSGPVIGTIHASKGREADNVFLLLPERDEFEDAADEEEETRILFVGSTRARSTLKVGRARKWVGSRIGSGRAFRRVADPRKTYAMIEVGRAEDIIAVDLVGRSAMPEDEARKAQDWLTTHSCAMVNGLRIASEANRDWSYRLFDPETETLLGWLSSRFQEDMWSIAKSIAEKKDTKLRTPSSIWYIKARGSRTIVLAPEDAQLEKLHAPWSQSGFMLAPRVASFTRAEFQELKK